MANKHERGNSMQDDFAFLLANPIYHDITLVCADGVEIGACRAILASRSDVFEAMLYGGMRRCHASRPSMCLYRENQPVYYSIDLRGLQRGGFLSYSQVGGPSTRPI